MVAPKCSPVVLGAMFPACATEDYNVQLQFHRFNAYRFLLSQCMVKAKLLTRLEMVLGL